MRTHHIAFIGLALLYAYCGCICKELVVSDNINNITPPVKILGEDIVYTERQVINLQTQQPVTIQLKMDVVCHKDDPANAAPRPMIIFFHGYNLIEYHKHASESYKYYRQVEHEQLMLDFARKHHCVVALVQYITTPLKWSDFALNFVKSSPCGENYIPLIDTLEEKRNNYFVTTQAKDAIRFLKSRHIEYNIDINNFTLIGFSAGGGIAASAAFINDPAFRPSWSFAQTDVIYNTNNPLPTNKLNLLMNVSKSQTKYYCNPIIDLPTTFPNPIPRIDLGSIEGRNTSTYNSSVKNVAMLCSALPDLVKINAVGPRLFIFGHDNDNSLINVRKQTLLTCSNKKPILIFNEIAVKARAAGYQDGVNLKVIQSNNNNHNYSKTGTLAGSYPNVTEAIWAFIK